MRPNNPELSPNVRHARYARSHHRAKQHADAHLEEHDPSHAIPQASDVPRNDPALITTEAALAEFLEHLRQSGSFAYDSEFIGELTYIPKLCVIQVATSSRVALIDPLAGLDLKPFWELVADERVEKIVHAGQQDVEPVIRHLGREAKNVFDTQIACGFIGMAYPVALSKLVAELIGAKLGKGLTFTHWDQRPLTPAQLRYAADDVRYLPRTRAEIGKRLEATGHTDWARQEFDAMCDARLYQFDPETAYLRVRSATSLGPQALAILRELVVWRDGVARAHDVPPRAFLKDEILVDLSRQPVKTLEKLDRVRGLPRPVEHAHGPEIVEATLRGLATPPGQFPFARHVEPSPTERFRADALWAVAQCICIGKSIDPSLVTSRQEIGEFHRAVAHDKDATDSPLLKSWRRAALGDPLMELLTRGGKVALDWNDQALRAL
ncbi:MAG: HRDC domain-containing protein [Tepidisphaeraceae bacterium]